MIASLNCLHFCQEQSFDGDAAPCGVRPGLSGKGSKSVFFGEMTVVQNGPQGCFHLDLLFLALLKGLLFLGFVFPGFLTISK